MAKKVRMDDIAKKLGVSKNTISLALRDMPVISEQTRELVKNTAKEMGYIYDKKNKLSGEEGITLKNICLFIPRSIQNVEFFSYIQFGMEKEARNHHLNIILYYLDEDDFTETPLCIQKGMVDGVIALGRFSRDAIASIQHFGLPVVVVDMYYDNLVMDYILTDNISSSFQMTEYLIQKGHTKIGFSGNIGYASSFYDRYQGFVKAMLTYSLPLLETWNLCDGFETYHQLLDYFSCHRSNLPQAFVCVNDAEAIELLKALEELLGPMQQQVSVTGFDNIPRSGECIPKLTTMHVQKEFMGEKAVQRLIDMMKNSEELPVKTLLSTVLIERESVIDLQSGKNQAAK